jgi:hypothetical protein
MNETVLNETKVTTPARIDSDMQQRKSNALEYHVVNMATQMKTISGVQKHKQHSKQHVFNTVNLTFRYLAPFPSSCEWLTSNIIIFSCVCVFV